MPALDDTKLMSKKLIHIACGCDDHYARHTAAMLLSLSEHLSNDVQVNVYVLHDDGLTETSVEAIRNSVPVNIEVHALYIDKLLMVGLPTHRFHPACWHRIFLPDLLPELDRILYLDSDMLVVDNIEPLWATDLNDKLFGAVVNPIYKFMASPISYLGLGSPGHYVNSGCLLMDLEKMRNSDFTEIIKQYAMAHPDNSWPEQDAISALWGADCHKLHPRWNLQSTFFDLPQSQLPIANGVIAEALADPAVIHFIGLHKPWHYLCRHVFRSEYFNVSKRTVWGAPVIEGKNLLNMILRPFSLGTQIRILHRVRRWLM